MSSCASDPEPDDTGIQIPSRYEFTKILSGAPWNAGQQAIGMAVGSDETVYIADGSTLWQVKNGTVSIYLGPSHGTFDFRDVDIDNNGVIYIYDYYATGGRILTSSSEGTFSEHRNISNLIDPRHIGVIDANTIAITSREGLSIV